MKKPNPAELDADRADPDARLFTAAAEVLRQNIPEWQRRAAAVLGHPVVLVADVGPLDGRFDRIGPFVELAIEGTLDALTLMQGDAALRPKLGGIGKVVIEPCPRGQTRCIAAYGGGTLSLCIPLESGARPTTHIVEAIRVAVGSAGP